MHNVAFTFVVPHKDQFYFSFACEFLQYTARRFTVTFVPAVVIFRLGDHAVRCFLRSFLTPPLIEESVVREKIYVEIGEILQGGNRHSASYYESIAGAIGAELKKSALVLDLD